MIGAANIRDAWRKFYCQLKGLPLFWQIVTLCGALIVVTIGATWIAADAIADQYKEALSRRFGIEIATAHAMFVDSLHRSLIVAGAFGFIATLIASFFFIPQILEPLQAMAGQADQVASGNLAVRVELGNVPESCEIHALGYAFNRMAEQLELQHKNRGQILADLSHDLITPLTNLKGYFEGINEGVVVPNASMYAMLEGEVSRLIRLVNDLHVLTLAEGARDELKPQEIRVDGLFQSGVEFIAAELAQKSIKADIDVQAGAEIIVADHDKIARVLRNILQNAAHFADPGSALRLDAHREPDAICLTIANTGEPLSERHIPHIFDRFYRADPARSRSGGAGLGLAIAKELVEAHSGKLTVAARGRETSFSICIPVRAIS